MKKNYSRNFNGKLKSYSALAGTLIAANQVNAQIVYTDIIPDSTVNTDGGSYNLDLNNDGTFDFTFNLTINPGGTSSSSPAYNKVGVTPLGSNQIAGTVSSPYIYPSALNTGDSVKSSLTWNIGNSQSMGSLWGGAYPYGNFLGTTDKHIGLQINVAGAIYYGWARVDVNADATSFTIKDYAYMNAADQPIMIGSASVGINENSAQGIQVFNDNRVIHVKNKNFSEGSIKITNTLGQELQNELMNSELTILSMENEKPGIYFVTVKSGQINYTKKIIIN